MRGILCIAGVLVMAFVDGFEPIRAEEPSVILLEVPPKEARDKVLAIVKDIHKEEYGEAKGNAQLCRFAATLLKEGRETRDDNTARFVLFAEAMTLATNASDWNLTLDAIDQIGAEFKIDMLAQKARSAGVIGKKLSVPAKQLEMLPSLAELAQQAVAKDRYEVAVDLGATAAAVARGCGSEIIGQVKSHNDKIAELKAEFMKIEEALLVLDKQPDDPQANLAFGIFYCFVKGDWERGLTGLALSSDVMVKDAATKDLHRPKQSDQQVALAEEWWNIGEQQGTNLKKLNARQRACYWYAQALPTLTGLTKTRVEKRIAEASRQDDRVEREVNNSIGMNLVYIPPGEFEMGSPATEEKRGVDEIRHHVKLPRGFYIGATEVTQGQWKAVMKTEPWKEKLYAKQGARYAATYVSRDDAVEFCNQLSAKEKKAYRLPTEAEWEYACRAGSQTAYSFGNDATQLSDYAWWGGVEGNGNAKSEQYTHEVGRKKANAWGLYDMHGNVFEWCSDWYGNYTNNGVDPVGPTSGSERVLRGGGWNGDARGSRAASRSKDSSETCVGNYGFRVAISVIPPTVSALAPAPLPMPITAPAIPGRTASSQIAKGKMFYSVARVETGLLVTVQNTRIGDASFAIAFSPLTPSAGTMSKRAGLDLEKLDAVDVQNLAKYPMVSIDWSNGEVTRVMVDGTPIPVRPSK